MMKWFMIRGPLFGIKHIEEQEDVKPEDKDWIYLKAPERWNDGGPENGENGTPTIKEAYPDGTCRVSKIFIGTSYFRTRSEAEIRLRELNRKFEPMPTLVEPSDLERATWLDATRSYVEQLEEFYHEHHEIHLAQISRESDK